MIRYDMFSRPCGPPVYADRVYKMKCIESKNRILLKGLGLQWTIYQAYLNPNKIYHNIIGFGRTSL